MDPVTVMTTAIGDLTDTVSGVAPAALAVGISVFGLGFAYKLVKRFAKG